jgi:hypothetical protein
MILGSEMVQVLASENATLANREIMRGQLIPLRLLVAHYMVIMLQVST